MEYESLKHLSESDQHSLHLIQSPNGGVTKGHGKLWETHL